MKDSKRKPIVGVMGGAQVTRQVFDMAFELGRLIAKEGWYLLNGGRDAGVMKASAMGARVEGGLTIGILPGDSAEEASPYVDIPIVTNLSDARNLINVLSSDSIVVCPGGPGTISEVALALKNRKRVILLNFQLKDFGDYERPSQLLFARTPRECIDLIKKTIQ